MLAYAEAGEGPAVVLLHGFPLDRSIWEPQLSYLAGSYRVIAPDLPGLGKSEPFVEGERPSIPAMARLVLDLLDHLGVEQAAVAGHSMGGYVTLALYKAAPDRVAGLGLVSTQAGADTSEARQTRFVTAEKVKEEGPGALVAGMGTRLFAPGVDPEGEVYRRVTRVIGNTSVAGIRGALFAMADREDLRSLLVQVKVPTLVLTGEEDQLIPAERSQVMAAAIPAAVLVKVPGAGHLPMLERPAEVNRAFEHWLDLVY